VTRKKSWNLEENALIDLTIHEEQLERSVRRAKERNVIIPTMKQQKDPAFVPAVVRKELRAPGSEGKNLEFPNPLVLL
jgi:hypothetical protein